MQENERQGYTQAEIDERLYEIAVKRMLEIPLSEQDYIWEAYGTLDGRCHFHVRQ